MITGPKFSIMTSSAYKKDGKITSRNKFSSSSSVLQQFIYKLCRSKMTGITELLFSCCRGRTGENLMDKLFLVIEDQSQSYT